jgi:phosphate uptake regulator
MILLSVTPLQSRDKNAASPFSASLYEMDDTVDALYWKYLRKVITPSKNEEDENKLEEKTEVMTCRCHHVRLIDFKISGTYFKPSLLCW